MFYSIRKHSIKSLLKYTFENTLKLKEMKTIKDLKKNDKFKFNDKIYTVKRCWINDDKPLIALDKWFDEGRFYYKGLEIEKI